MIDHGKHNVLGAMIDAVDYDVAVERIMAAAIARQPLAVSALAVHGVMTGVLDREHRQRLNSFHMLLPDGQPVRWALRWLYGLALRDRVYGPELMLRVCSEAGSRKLPVFLFGGTERLLTALSERLRGRFPGLQVAGVEPSRFRNITADEHAEVLNRINGSVGDEGLFDVAQYQDAFPFRSNSPYTTLDFMAEGTALESKLATKNLQDVEWKSSNAPQSSLVGKKLLDPVPGTPPMNSASKILSLPNPDAILVSPLFKSDVSMAETDPSKYGSPASNLQGERRGLLAFKIVSARSNPKGGSYLPLITIEVVDPASVNLYELTISSNGGNGGTKVRLVQ